VARSRDFGAKSSSRPHAALVLLLLSGCYASHVRQVDADVDAPVVCAAAGTHRVLVSIESSSCGAAGTTREIDVTIPPTEDAFGTDCATTITRRGACRWDVVSECLVPDLSRRATGTIDATSAGVTARFDVASTSGWTGETCTAVELWGSAADD
jgi:hypothetical protein